jgi:hypothetical protein
MAKQAPFDINRINLDGTKSFEMDIGKDVFRSDGPENHQRMMEAMAMFKEVKATEQAPQVIVAGTPSNSTIKHGLTVPKVMDMLYLLKKDLKEATRLSYEKTAKEFSDFLKKPLVYDILPSDITRYQEYLASEHKIGKATKKANSTRTIDNKIANLNAIFNFAIKQGYSNSKNPAAERQQTSNQKRKEADKRVIFDTNEIRKIFWSTPMAEAKKKNPDFYWVMLIGIHIYLGKSKAGKRMVPIPQKQLDSGLEEFMKDKDRVFKYTDRLGKGSGNAVGKKFKRLLEKQDINRDKLVFHSLRKFVNNFFKQKGVAYEERCQLIGHEVEDINNHVYAHDSSVEDLAKLLKPLQTDWEQLSGLALA